MDFFHNRPQNMNLNSTLRYEDNYINSLKFNGYELMRPTTVPTNHVYSTYLPSTPPHLQISSPKTPPTVIKRRTSTSSLSSTTSSMSSSSTEMDETKLQPFTTYRLKPISQKVKSMVMTLTERGLVCLEFLKVKNGAEKIVETFTVSQDGEEISIMYPRQSQDETSDKRNKSFRLHELPEKYHKKYEHARKFVALIQSKTPKITMYNQRAKCMMMENLPNPNFEVHFYSGRKIINNWSGMKLVDEQQGSILSLSSPRIQQQFSSEIQDLIKFTEQCQQQCLQFEALIKSTASSVDDKNELFPVIIGKKPAIVPVKEEPVPSQPENRPTDISIISSITSSSSSSTSTDTGSNVLRQIRVPNIGIASQLDNGDIWVEFEDGSHLGIKPTVTTVTYINSNGLMTKYRKSQPLPENVKIKLASVPLVLEQLMTTQKSASVMERSL